MLRTLEQERANYAWKCINAIKANNRKRIDEESGLLSKIIEIRKESLKKRIKEEEKVKEELDKEIKSYYDNIEKKYRPYITKTPTLIQTNGLGNTLAFYKSKFGQEKEEKLSAEKRAYKLLYEHINTWFKERFENRDILEWIIDENTSSIDVFKATKEVLALLNWMKRFAEAELKEEG